MNDFQIYLEDALKRVTIEKEAVEERADDYNICEEIAAAIVTARNELGLTQKELAKLSGVSQANISKFETGSSCPHISTLKKIADGLGKKLVVAFADGEEGE